MRTSSAYAVTFTPWQRLQNFLIAIPLGMIGGTALGAAIRWSVFDFTKDAALQHWMLLGFATAMLAIALIMALGLWGAIVMWREDTVRRRHNDLSHHRMAGGITMLLFIGLWLLLP